jgi:peptide/nickel transport system substrate-binding protein
VDAAVTEEGKLIEDVTGPSGDTPGGNYDMYMWGWVGDPDPTSLLDFFRTEQIGGSSDSYYSNPQYDQWFLDQRAEADPEARAQILDDMQQLVYDEAPYHILYYDSELHAYRTDKFGGWVNQPEENGTPLFGYGPFGYTKLAAASLEPSPGPSASAGAQSPGATTGTSSPAPTSGGEDPASSGSNTILLLAGVAALVAVLAVGFVALRRRSGAQEEE